MCRQIPRADAEIPASGLYHLASEPIDKHALLHLFRELTSIMSKASSVHASVCATA
jgi:hypothetical protein